MDILNLTFQDLWDIHGCFDKFSNTLLLAEHRRLCSKTYKLGEDQYKHDEEMLIRVRDEILRRMENGYGN